MQSNTTKKSNWLSAVEAALQQFKNGRSIFLKEEHPDDVKYAFQKPLSTLHSLPEISGLITATNYHSTKRTIVEGIREIIRTVTDPDMLHKTESVIAHGDSVVKNFNSLIKILEEREEEIIIAEATPTRPVGFTAQSAPAPMVF